MQNETNKQITVSIDQSENELFKEAMNGSE